MAFAYCGLDCEICDYRERMNCPGCKACGGEMFWGKCSIAACCITKQIENCSKCDQFHPLLWLSFPPHLFLHVFEL